MSFDSYDGGLPGLSDEELLRVYGLAKRDHNYEGPIDDWPKRAERAATVAGLRAAIAADRAQRQPEPEPEGPTDEELSKLLYNEFTTNTGHGWHEDVIGFARAVLARWGRPTPQPEPGEVQELVEWLRQEAAEYHPGDGDALPSDVRDTLLDASARCTRAAELLSQRHPQPVPVSERLPGPEDMTEDGEVWIEDPGHNYPLADTGDCDWEPHKWILRPIGKFDAKNGLRWLPAHALPLPGEVES